MTHEANGKHDSSGEPADKSGELPDEVLLAETAPLSGKTILTLLKETLPLIGFLLLPAFVLRALITARFDFTVAVALVQFTPPVSFLLAFLIDTLPILLYALGVFVLFGTGRSYRDGSSSGPLPGLAAFLLALLLSVPIYMASPYPDYILYVLLLVPLTATFKAGKQRSLGKNRNFRQLLRSAKTAEEFGVIETHFVLRDHLVAAIIIGIIFATFKGIWLAPEILTIRGIPKTEYVLQQQDQHLIVFDLDLDAVIRIPTTDVTDRQFCNIRSFTVAERLFDSPEGRPFCPK